MANGSGGLVCRVGTWKGSLLGGGALTADTWGNGVLKLCSLDSHFANVLRRQICGMHLFGTFESFIQEVPLFPMSDVVPQGTPSDAAEKVVIGMGCLFQAFLSLGSGGRQDG